MISPLILAQPIQFIPQSLQKAVLEQVLNRVFKTALSDGEMDFLQSGAIRVHITDVPFDWRFQVQQGYLQAGTDTHYTAEIRGNFKAFTALASQTVDPDTLFFQRRLVIEGDTELGLHMKNFMDSIDYSALPLGSGKAISKLAKLMLRVLE